MCRELIPPASEALGAEGHTHGVIQGGSEEGVSADAVDDNQHVVTAADKQAQKGEGHRCTGTRHQRMRLHVMHRHILQPMRSRKLPRLLHPHLHPAQLNTSMGVLP